MREYNKDLVDALQANQEEVDIRGTRIIIKASPEETRPGYLDPRELEMIKKAMMGNEQRPEQGTTAEPTLPEHALQAMRDHMGFPNRNLNLSEIHTQYEKIRLGENDVGLWRYYTKRSMRKKGKPCLIYFHGGGWVGGSVYGVENSCRLIAELADAVVFNIDYSLAPEKKFPNGFNDCFHAVKYIYDHSEVFGIDRTKIAVGGDSAGGNLAAAVAVKNRELDLQMIALQVLIYPCVTFFTKGVEGYKWDIDDYEIAEEQSEMINLVLGVGRPTEDRDDDPMSDLYFTNKADAKSPYASPLFVDSKGLPKTLCVSAEFDGARIQAELYSKKLALSQVPVKTIRYKGCTHGFFDKLGFLPQTEDLCIEIANAMKEI
ncbi:alpha/beta hydrolase [Paenibacillus xanthanilyticus]|uniref:Alpha/beta hydrolase n=1 Tax=Paenibacillus xanthanilyticus TaxID=1783531 RepID=A0ABV8K9N4_9BACL